MAVAVVEVAAVAAVAARHLKLRLPARELALRAVEVAAHLRQALVADGQPHLLVVDEGVDQVVALADVVRIDQRLAEPLAEQAAAHRRLALREDAEERGVLVGLARLRVDRERAHRAAVEPHELRGLDPLQRPLAVRVGVGEHVEVLEQPARRADREELRALEGAAVELLLAEEAAQVLLVVLRRERALLAVDVRHLAQLQHLGELLPLAVAEVGRQHALLRRLLAHERLERREVLVVLKLEHRIEWDPASTKATPTSRALPAYPFEPAVLPTRTAAITADASSWPASSWHSSAKGCRLPGEPRRAHAHSRPSRRYSSTRRFCCSSASRITSFAWFLLIVRYAWRSSPSCTCFTAPEFLKYSTATVCASRPCSEKKSLRSKKRSRSAAARRAI